LHNSSIVLARLVIKLDHFWGRSLALFDERFVDFGGRYRREKPSLARLKLTDVKGYERLILAKSAKKARILAQL
jgi:hypothetical protein